MCCIILNYQDIRQAINYNRGYRKKTGAHPTLTNLSSIIAANVPAKGQHEKISKI